MDLVNLATWKAFDGIISNRNSKVKCYIPHPTDSNRKLFSLLMLPIYQKI